MFHRTRKLALAAAAALAIAQAGVCMAQSQAPAATPATGATQDVSSEIKALRNRLDQLESQQAEERRLAAIRQTTDEVSADAARRSTLMIDTGGFNGGFEDDRFVIRSADGNFSLKPWLHLQFRNVTLYRDGFKKGDRDELDNGFEVRRMKLGFDGNMFGKDLTYLFNWATARASGTNNVTDATGAKIGTVSNSIGGAPILEEAWVKYHFHETPWYIKAGQIKDPLMHEQIVSSKYQQSAERSLLSDVFANGDAFTKGVTIIYDPKDWVRVEAGVTDGLRSANTNFLDYPQGGNGFDYGFAGRAEFKLMGQWKDYNQIGGVGVKEPLLVIGIGADYSERGHFSQTVGVVDLHYANEQGFNLYAAAVDRYSTHNYGFQNASASGISVGTPPAGVADQSTNEYAFLIQAGYIINKQWEPFARWEYFHVEGTAAGSQNYFSNFTGGINYYFAGHRAKFTAEVQYLPDGMPFDDSANGLLNNNGKSIISGVVQFQLLL